MLLKGVMHGRPMNLALQSILITRQLSARGLDVPDNFDWHKALDPHLSESENFAKILTEELYLSSNVPLERDQETAEEFAEQEYNRERREEIEQDLANLHSAFLGGQISLGEYNDRTLIHV